MGKANLGFGNHSKLYNRRGNSAYRLPMPDPSSQDRDDRSRDEKSRDQHSCANSESQRSPISEFADFFADFFALRGSIGRKLVVSLALMFVLFLSINEAVHQLIIKPTFQQRDQADAVNGFTRVLAAINYETDKLQRVADLVSKTQDDELTANLLFDEDDQMFAVYATMDGHDSKHSENNEGETSEIVNANLAALSAVDRDRMVQAVQDCLRTVGTDCRGVLKLSSSKVVLVAAVRSLDERIWVVGRPFDDSFVAELSKRTGSDFCIRVAKGISHCSATTKLNPASNELIVRSQLRGLDGQRTSDVTLKVPPHHSIDSAQTFAVARRSFVLCSIAALLFLLLLLGRLVIRPLTLLRTQIREIGDESKEIDHLKFDSEDEIADLAESFDAMMSRLSKAQDQLAEAALASGRSEVAATVIHNVGNVLTNVNSLVDTARNRIGTMQLHSLHRLADRLDDAESHQELIEATPKYLHGLARKWEADQEELSMLLVTLEDNLRHIHDVIRDQQRHASQAIKVEGVQLSELIDEAIGCCRARLNSDSVIVTVPDHKDADADSPFAESQNANSPIADSIVMVDRSLTLQVMINVITNARQAMSGNPMDERQIDVSVNPANGFVEVSFRDAGSGMDAETIQRAFDAHFTTRETGSGLGLHFCAISLKRFGGLIRVESDGLGHGSTVTLAFPCPQACISGSADEADCFNEPHNQSPTTLDSAVYAEA